MPWTKNTRISNQQSKRTPALAVLGKHLHMVNLHRSTNQLCHSVRRSSGASWSSSRRILSEKCFGKLRSPVARIGFAPTPCPTVRHLENEFYPSAVDIIHEVERKLDLDPIDLSQEEFYSHEKRFTGPF